MSGPYNLKGTDLEKWVCASDTHSGAPIPRAEAAEEEVSQGQAAERKPEGVN